MSAPAAGERRIGEAGAREVLAFALGILALTLLVLLGSDGFILLTRQLWVDEWYTVFVAQRPSPFAVIGDLAHGADGGAGLVHLAAWALRSIGVVLSPVSLHLLSLGCVVATLAVVYAILRRRFSTSAGVAGALAVGANALVVAHSYEGRFYAPWLLCCALYAWSLAASQRRPRDRRQSVVVAVAAVLLCTVHFYGIITLAIMAAGVVAAHGRRWREGMRVVAPSVAGALALPLVIPLAIGQRRAYTVPSWLPDFNVGQLSSLAGIFWSSTIPVLAATAILLVVVLRRARGDAVDITAPARAIADDAGVAALASLAIVPVALAVLSLAGQPSMLSRYAIATALAWAPWVALSAEVMGRRAAIALHLVIVWVWVSAYSREAALKRAFQGSLDRGAAIYTDAAAAGVPVIFQSSHVMYPILGPQWLRGDRPSAGYLELPDSTLRRLFPDSAPIGQLNRGTVLDRDLARVHATRWGFPRLAPLAAVDSMSRFLFMAPEERLPVGFSGVEHFAQVFFPRHTIHRLGPDLSLLIRRK